MWVHQGCSEVKRRLTSVRGRVFEYTRCKTLEPSNMKHDELTVAEDLYGRVGHFFYLKDMLGAGRGIDTTVTVRLKSGCLSLKS
jgi:hypothetical protein